jgi:hypothetical protein
MASSGTRSSVPNQRVAVSMRSDTARPSCPAPRAHTLAPTAGCGAPGPSVTTAAAPIATSGTPTMTARSSQDESATEAEGAGTGRPGQS